MSVISAWQSIREGFDFTYLLTMLMGIIPALICIPLHELSHGYIAYRLGDTTAKDRGRLTLNPLKHIDVMGLIMMVTFHVGWAKPVPINMTRFRNPKRGMALTALAGPLCNVLITLVFLFLYGLLYIPLSAGRAGQYVLIIIMLTAYCSLGLALFNLIPIPPLDGSKILAVILPDEKYYKLMRYEKYGMIALVVLVATGVVGKPLTAAIDFVFDALTPVAQAGCDLVYTLVSGR